MRPPYQQFISEEISRQGKIGIDPRHVEAYMRLEHSTLDDLSPAGFSKEVSIGIECVETGGIINAERNAQSFGL